MRERLLALLARAKRPGHPWTIVVGVVVGFIVVVGTNLHPPDPESRLPGSYRLAELINRQQNENEVQKSEVERLRKQLENGRTAALNQRAGLDTRNDALVEVGIRAGTAAVEGVGFTVTLDDSSLSSSPTDNLNDLVIHSQDVQAVVNAMWGAGAEAISINGERLVATSAILCVGNTLLLNGSVHSPPYEISAIGAQRDLFQDDALVKELKSAAERFSLRFSVGRDVTLELEGYNGTTTPRYAQPVPGAKKTS